jgi:hypothetical protein
MPRPVYILCSESGTEDKQTGLLSFFHVIEKIQIISVPEADEQGRVFLTSQRIRVVAVWMRGEEDSPTQEFEYQTVLVLPPYHKEIPSGYGRFVFSKPLHRFTVSDLGPLLFEGPGIMRAESRLRKLGEQTWLKQDYPIIVEEFQPHPGNRQEG